MPKYVSLFRDVIAVSTVLFAMQLSAGHFEITDLGPVQSFDLGEVVYFEKGELHSDLSRGLEGRATTKQLEKPSVSYFLHVIPTTGHFYLKIGCRVITKVVQFDPFMLREGVPVLNNDPHYVSEVRYGGAKSQAFSYLQSKHVPLPQNVRIEFGDDSAELERFESLLAGLLEDYEGIFHLESTSAHAIESAGVGDMMTFVEPNEVVLAGPGRLKQLVEIIFKRGAPQAMLRASSRLAAGSLLALTRYVDLLLVSGRSQREAIIVDDLSFM